MGVKHSILKQVFKVHQVESVFSDAVHGYFANAAGVTLTCKRVGQICIGNSGATWLAYIGISAGDTANTGWVALTIT